MIASLIVIECIFLFFGIHRMQVVGEGRRRGHKLIAEDDLGKTMPAPASYCYCLLLHATAYYCILLPATVAVQ